LNEAATGVMALDKSVQVLPFAPKPGRSACNLSLVRGSVLAVIEIWKI